jgi:hypothetical protein
MAALAAALKIFSLAADLPRFPESIPALIRVPIRIVIPTRARFDPDSWGDVVAADRTPRHPLPGPAEGKSKARRLRRRVEG